MVISRSAIAAGFTAANRLGNRFTLHRAMSLCANTWLTKDLILEPADMTLDNFVIEGFCLCAVHRARHLM